MLRKSVVKLKNNFIFVKIKLRDFKEKPKEFLGSLWR